MNKFLATTAVVLVGFVGAASAQQAVDPAETAPVTLSTLEAVLAKIEATKVNGTFLNIAENSAEIDGSIANIVEGVETAVETVTAATGVTSTVNQLQTVNFGSMATTALGAVNTGTITLGVNSKVDEAKTTSTQAVSSVMNQLGGSTDTAAIIMNIASNLNDIDGSISNTMTGVNGATGALSTTALGAVNTGIITSGVNAAVQGIVGTSGAN